ncbi:hypothetical protein R6Q57_008294 [Mikania cordata]
MVVKPSISGQEFEVGDMVWAKMKSQPWWPGHVYNEQLATPLVRQSKRDGLLLVAFFGSSSYGWFHSSLLIPFDSNYAEKSLQTDSKTFVRAVKDAIREVNRRIDLGLSCMCCNKQTFREIDVQGFVSVDVAGYDPGAVYSIDLIKKARDSFQPELTLDFLKRMALEPTVSEHVDIGFIKYKATVMAFRKVVYGDFDQAFGYDPVRVPIQEPAPREMLSKVAAGNFALKSETVSLEDAPPTVFKFSNTRVVMSTSIVESSTSSAADPDQAKVRLAPPKKIGQPEGPQRSDGNHRTEVSRELSDLLSLAVDPFNTVNGGSLINARKTFLRFRSLVFQKGRNFSLQLAGDVTSAGKSSERVPPVKTRGCLKHGPSACHIEMTANKRKKIVDIRNVTNEKKVMMKLDEPAAPEPGSELIKKTEQQAPEPTMLMMRFPQGGSLPSFSELKARFVCYGPLDHSATQIFQKTSSCRVVFRDKIHAQEAYKSVIGSSNLFGNTDVKCRLKEVEVGASQPGPPVVVPQEAHPHSAMEDRPLSCLLSVLQSLAVDPFNTVNRESHVKGKKAFLRFRSLVFQKSQNFSPLAAGEPNVNKSLEDHVEMPPVKPQDGLKRGPSDHREEMDLAKRKKPVATSLKKPEPAFIKKTEQPTMLMIKFPKGGSLPSFKELKARFASYGPMDHSGTHIFWNTFSCQVVFRYKAHAQAAYRFVVESSSLFGNTGVKCTLKAAGIMGSAKAEPSIKVPKEDHRQPDMKHRLPSGGELKSILKKSGGDEAADGDVRGCKKFKLGQLKNNMKKSGSEEAADVSAIVANCTPGSPPPPPPPMRYGTPLLATPPSLPPRSMQMTPLQVPNRPLNAPPLMTPNIDIAQQMLSLLIRCNDVVANVSSSLGYMPYHPL